MTGYVADLSWKSGVRAIEKLDRLRSTLAILTLNVLTTTIVAPPSNASKRQIGFNSAFKGLSMNY